VERYKDNGSVTWFAVPHTDNPLPASLNIELDIKSGEGDFEPSNSFYLWRPLYPRTKEWVR